MTEIHPFTGIRRDECAPGLARRILKLRRTEPELARQIENRECPTCEAKPGELCRKSSGNVTWYHTPRTGLDG